MFSNSDSLSRIEAIILLLASSALFVWYATPQLFFSLYPLYELVRLFWPGLFPDVQGG